MSCHLPWYRPIQRQPTLLWWLQGPQKSVKELTGSQASKHTELNVSPELRAMSLTLIPDGTALSVLIEFVCFSTASENGWGGMSSAFHCLHSRSFHMNNRLQTKTSVCLAGVKHYARKVKKVCWEGYYLYFTSQIWYARAIKCEIIRFVKRLMSLTINRSPCAAAAYSVWKELMKSWW